MRHRFFSLLLLGLGLGGVMPSMAQDQTDELIIVSDLQALGQQANKLKLPILMMFSQDNCPYCVLMEENYLRPLLRNREYDEKLLIRKFKIDSDKTLTDFDGSPIKAQALKDRYQSYVTPTLVFVNSNGEQIATKLVGIGTEGFFAGDIDQAIEMARRHLQSVAFKQ